ncbi:unnamed protein product, partial [Adineta steineri]
MVRQKFVINPLEKTEIDQDCSCLRNFLNRLTTRKTITQLQAEAEGDNELKRTLTTFQLLALGVGSIIGTGIFVLSGEAAAKYAGPAI